MRESKSPGHTRHNATHFGSLNEFSVQRSKIHGVYQASGPVTKRYAHSVTSSRAFSGKSVSGEQKGIQTQLDALKKHLGVGSGRKLAVLLGVSPMAVSRWEAGKEPDERGFIQLAKVAPEGLRWEFLDRAGISRSDVLSFFPDHPLASANRPPPQIEVSPSVGALGRFSLKKRSDYVAVPLLRDSAAAGEPRLIDDSQVEDMIIMRSSITPHPDETVCVKVSGDSMSPILLDGYVVAIDTRVTDRKLLYRQMVAAIGPSGGCTIKWLRKSGSDELLVPQHTAPHYDPIVITANPDWRIIGKILWWLGTPPPIKK